MSETDNSEFVKTPEFREWLLGLLADEKNPTTVTFTKKDGTNRVMKCTRSPSQIPEDQYPKDGVSVEATGTIRVFDLDKNEWRSFIVENIKRIEYTF
jgi:hypothetical protein